MRSVPSGMRIIRWTSPAVPISYMSSKPACSTSESRVVTSASIRSPATTSSISFTERSWPIASGVIDWGKTTVSLSGRTGSGGRDLDVALEGLRLGHLVAHATVRIVIAIRSRRGGAATTGSTTVSRPRSYVARAPSGSTFSGSAIRRSKGPYSISSRW